MRILFTGQRIHVEKMSSRIQLDYKKKSDRYVDFLGVFNVRDHSFSTYAQISRFQTHPVRTNYDVTMTTMHWHTHGG